jgi:predicted permease
MNIFFASFQAVFILMGMGIIGFWIIAKRIVPVTILDVLSPLVIEIALPCMVFSDIVSKFDPVSYPNWWTLPFWWGICIAILLALSLVSMFLFGGDKKKEFGISLLYPNAIFFPLAIIPIIFGQDSPLLVELFIFTIFFPVFLFNSYKLFFLKKDTNVKFSMQWKKVFNPILLATIFAIVLKIAGFSKFVPEFIVSITKSIGSIAFPLIMILVGGNIYVDMQKRGRFHKKDVFKFVIIKNIVFPVVMLGFLILVKPDKNVALLMFLQSLVPPVTTIPILVQREGGNVSITNQFLISSFTFSIFSVPVGIWIFNKYFGII